MEGVAEIARRQQAGGAGAAFGLQLVEMIDGRAEAQHEADLRPDPRRFGRLDHSPGVVRFERDWFFDEEMQAVPGGEFDLIGVAVGRQADKDGIEFRAVEHLPVGGEHGYDNASPEMAAVFIANGPAIRRGVRLPPFDNVDVYPLLARLVGVAPRPNDGNLADLVPALQP